MDFAPSPEYQLQLDPALASLAFDTPATSVAPPLSTDPGILTPSLFPSVPGLGGGGPDAMSDLFSNYAEPSPSKSAMDVITGAVEGLDTRPGLQIGKEGIGTTVGDWRLRFMPYIPYLNEP